MTEFPVDASALIGAGRLTVDLHSLVQNYQTIVRRAAPAQTAAVVKADAYGLGARQVVGALRSAGCRSFFVAHLSEALRVRDQTGDDGEIFVLNGLPPGAEPICAQAQGIPVLNSMDQLERWNDLGVALGRGLPAAIQLDSGMARLGLSQDETQRVAADPHRLKGVELRLVMSHLACADIPGAPSIERQRERFEAMAGLLPPAPRSLANSAAALGPRSLHYDLVRAGIGLYGGAPHEGLLNPMRPVVRLEASIIQLRTVPDGAPVGYGLTYVARGERRLATLSVGYADGWPRRLGNRGAAFVAGVRAPIVGRVSMDSMTVDVTAASPSALWPGAPVELIGEHQSLEQVAADAETIPYEILTQIGSRFRRTYRPAQIASAQERAAS
jgi:alanine racemase